MDIESDHKPLETILRKPTPAHLQPFRNTFISVTYKPGKQLLIADTLSRAPLSEVANELEFQQYDINILHTLPIIEPKLEEFKAETKSDPALQDLMHIVQTGWPENKASTPPGARPFWKFHDEVTYHLYQLPCIPECYSSPWSRQMQTPSSGFRLLARYGRPN